MTPRAAMVLNAGALADYRDHHAMVFLPPEVAGPIEAIRGRWDPEMAARIPAHVTLAYPQEAPIVDLLDRRVQDACHRYRPFRLRLGEVACFERPDGGVYVTVEDLDGSYRSIRDELLRPPFSSMAFPPHVTLVHPRTSPRGREFWDRRGDDREEREFTAEQVAITAFDGVRWVVVARYTLAGR